MHLPVIPWGQLVVLSIHRTETFFDDVTPGLLATLEQCVELKELTLYLTFPERSGPPPLTRVTLPALIFLNVKFDISPDDETCHLFDSLILLNLQSLQFKCRDYFGREREMPAIARCIDSSRSPVSFLHIQISDETVTALLPILRVVSPTLQELQLNTWIESEDISTVLTVLIVSADCDPRDVLCPKLELFSLEYFTPPSKDECLELFASRTCTSSENMGISKLQQMRFLWSFSDEVTWFTDNELRTFRNAGLTVTVRETSKNGTQEEEK
jgi:hypothetical protein